ncbi:MULTISPECIES: glycosyltransferase family protein [unclassified Shinella]|uniref:glycosyltransferase family protein n=1 Tax=unclassified Shinella TaxID=2643062 RepID=UPI00225C7DD2|nr:glycosyltransferase [Shinella sp. YE25]MDC7259342.1 glycosyl transferase [Shinella sp. YE25]CAI0336134.1 Glycosyl transferase [Rhizobiaceae bacterium]CAK7261521.1 Glycosyl transferase [Shinella sp. WSC3-e]
MSGPRVLFYVQHLLGIGHLARASRIVRALVDDGFAVTLVTGGMPVDGFPGPGIDHVALPAIAVGDGGFSALVDANGTVIDEVFKAARRDRLLAAYHAMRPDIVIVEAFPFGRRQVRFELLPLIAAIEASTPRPLLLTSLRDILQERAKPGRDEETIDLVLRHFDGVLVHGDPAFVRLEDTFPLADAIAGRVVYTGLVGSPAAGPAAERYDVVVSAGGGAVGAGLVEAALAASGRRTGSGRWLVITGPNLPQADFARLSAARPAHVDLVRFRTDFRNLLAAARLSVSQAGYNTVCDVLQAGCGAVLVPFASGGESEQTARAERLERLGRAVVLREDILSGETLADAILRAEEAGTEKNVPVLQLDGANRTAKILRDLLKRRVTS